MEQYSTIGESSNDNADNGRINVTNIGSASREYISIIWIVIEHDNINSKWHSFTIYSMGQSTHTRRMLFER